MFVCFLKEQYIIQNETDVFGLAIKKWMEQNDGGCYFLPFLIFKNADNKVIVGWNPSPTDILSNDWGLVHDPVEGCSSAISIRYKDVDC